MLIGCSVMSTSIGASGAVMTSGDDDPMWRHTMVSVVRARLPERVPVVAVEAGQLELGGVLGERHGVAALGRHPPHLVGHELRGPRWAG